MAHWFADKRVLIVEDEHFIAIDLAYELSAAGAKVIGPIASVAAALDVITVADLDGVILNLDLRGTMAFPVADALAERQIPFVFVTGYAVTEIPARHANALCVEKPAAPSVICGALEEAMRSTGNREE
jgi:DNA-binding response OmpR family regulator